MSWRPLTKDEMLQEFSQNGELPDAPQTLNCCVCDTLIGDQEWDWAAMPTNGPVHAHCFKTDTELLAEFDHITPCFGCDTTCDQWATECALVDVIGLMDGIDNCMIVRPGPERDYIADHYRAQGYRVVH